METRELIAKLEATADQADALTRQLIDDLKEHAAALDALDRIELWRREQRGAAIAIAIEAHTTINAANRLSTFRKVLGRAMGAV